MSLIQAWRSCPIHSRKICKAWNMKSRTKRTFCRIFPLLVHWLCSSADGFKAHKSKQVSAKYFAHDAAMALIRILFERSDKADATEAVFLLYNYPYKRGVDGGGGWQSYLMHSSWCTNDRRFIENERFARRVNNECWVKNSLCINQRQVTWQRRI